VFPVPGTLPRSKIENATVLQERRNHHARGNFKKHPARALICGK